MTKIKQFYKIFLITIFLSSCRTSINNEYPIINSEENINENDNSETKRMEIKFSCGEDGISEYLEDGWIILKEDSKESMYEQNNLEKERMEIKISCDEDGILQYLDDGWIILKEESQEKIYLLEK